MTYFLLLALYLACAVQAKTYKASITWYGTKDERNSGNCNNTGACGFHTSPGFAAAVSQNLFGTDHGVGEYCGKCLELNIQTDEFGRALNGTGKNVVLVVNNVCPAQDNRLCAQPDLQTPNHLGGIIDVNVCSDSGARSAVFGFSGKGLALGTAEEVDCGSWNGTKVEFGSGTSATKSVGSLTSEPTTPGTDSGAAVTRTTTAGANVADVELKWALGALLGGFWLCI
ncbi:hypothetical protein EJ08DRAFT_52878 [Tothia fuscella]|uniref:Expansin-like EG45 domain-containing protein n=1 Tax=Tothia fuscella TaxID=1048955 RepID=A0A9P4NF92_9PEZI|nr:hypothetical protein EJ08DRAFT_52878 [Tothia fuscella]